MKKISNPGIESWLLLSTLSLIWGSSFILIKKGLLVYTPVELAGLRIASAGLVLLPFAYRNRRYFRARKWPFIAISGLLGSFLPAFLFATAQTQLSSAITGVMNATTPLFALLIGGLFFYQKITAQSIIGVILGLLGAVILSLAKTDGFGEMNYYIFLVMGATLCYGTNLNLIKFYLADTPSLAITSLSLTVVFPLALIMLFSTSFFEKTANWQESWFAFTGISTLGVVGTGFALILFNRLVKLTNPVFTSLVTYFIPIVAIIWGLTDGEEINSYQILGILIILIGVYIANRRRVKK